MNRRRTDWLKEKANGKAQGMYECRKCKSFKTSYYQLQTRGADEPMTSY